MLAGCSEESVTMFHLAPKSFLRLRRASVGAVLAASLSFAALPATASAQLTIDQLELQLDPRSVDRKVGVFSITNEGTESVQVALHAEDWDRAESGENRFFPLGSQPHSCGEKLSVFPLSMRLDPGATGQVRVSADGLAGAPDACWQIVFAETARPPRPAGAQRAILYVVRTGVKVYVEPSGLQKDGAVEDVALKPHLLPNGTPAVPAARDLVVAFRNTGAISLRTTGRVEFRRADNSVAATATITEFPTLPGARRNVAVVLPQLPAGKYTALAMLDFGGSEIAAGQIDLDVR
jgi:P pilus assembly chaperone PapD